MNSKYAEETYPKPSSNEPSLLHVCLDGDRVSGSESEFAAVVGIAAGVGVIIVVSAVVWVMEGSLSLPSDFSLSLPPNSLFHGILP